MIPKFNWPKDLLDWHEVDEGYKWRSISVFDSQEGQCSGSYHETKPVINHRFKQFMGGNEWLDAGFTTDAEATNLWQRSLQKRPKVKKLITMERGIKTIDLSQCDFEVWFNNNGSGVKCHAQIDGKDTGIYIEILIDQPIPTFFNDKTRAAILAAFNELI